MSKVLSWLYLGSALDAANLQFLNQHNISYILNVAVEVEDPVHSGFVQAKIDLDDYNFNQNWNSQIETALRFIDGARKQGKSILVHCFAGWNRGTSVIMEYLKRYYG